jgi:hypothetical protein
MTVLAHDLCTLINSRRPMGLGSRLLSWSPWTRLWRLLESRLLSKVLLSSSLCCSIVRLNTRECSCTCDASSRIASLDIRPRLLARPNDGCLWWRWRTPLGTGCRGRGSRTDTVDRALRGLQAGRGSSHRALPGRRRVVLLTVVILIRIYRSLCRGTRRRTSRRPGVRPSC